MPPRSARRRTAAAALSLLLAGLPGLCPPAHAAPRGPGGFSNDVNPPSTVREVRARGYDDQNVVLIGRLTAYYGKDKYEFTDLNGDIIEVELDDDHDWSHISKDQLIVIEGEVERDFFSVSIEVDRAYAAPQGQGGLPPAPLPPR